MFPYFIFFGRLIGMYGVSILVGVCASFFIIFYLSRKLGFPAAHAIYAFCYGFIGALLGAKILYLLTIIPELIQNHAMLLQNSNIVFQYIFSGFVFYGGLFGSIAGVFIYAKQYHISVSSLFLVLIPVVPMLHAFGRIGCFMAGCCYGIPYDGAFHVVFSRSITAPNGIPLFPVQLLESGLLFLLSFLLLYLFRCKKVTWVSGAYCVLYAIIRFITERFRGDSIRGIYGCFSTSQWISIGLFLVGCALLFYPYFKKTRKPI